jgi:hypothetical protein
MTDKMIIKPTTPMAQPDISDEIPQRGRKTQNLPRFDSCGQQGRCPTVYWDLPSADMDIFFFKTDLAADEGEVFIRDRSYDCEHCLSISS